MNDATMETRAEEIFLEALPLSGTDRAALLERRCASDAVLRSEVEALLAHAGAAHSEFLVGRPLDDLGLFANLHAGVADSHAYGQSLIGERLGRYRLARLIGSGGMGLVFEAEQENPRRRVALKLLRYGQSIPSIVRRFQREADLLARLEHPAIARIFDAGVAELEGGRQPYLAMEYAQGLPLDAWARGRTVREKLRLFAVLCDAVQYAHEHGVMHRDLKPANVLVDDKGDPRILDFGIARALNAGLQTLTQHTAVGHLLGTVPYMSPEQVLGDSRRLDARTDVYSLGVILFEILGQRLPLDLRYRSIPEAVRMIREEEPTRLGSIDAAFRGDIDTIVTKALEKEPTRRYQTAAELGADIRRVLDDRPIQARPASALYQFRKFARRNKSLVGAILSVMVCLVAATAFSMHYAIGESRERRLADREAHRARMFAAAAAIADSNPLGARRSLDESSPEQRSTWEWRYLSALLDSSDRVLEGHTGPVRSIDFSPDGTRLVSGSADHSVRIWRLDGTSTPIVLAGHTDEVRQVAIDPNGSVVASCADDATIRIWNAASGQPVAVWNSASRARAIAFSPDGAHVVSLHVAHRVPGTTFSQSDVCLWNVADGTVAQTWKTGKGQSTLAIQYAAHGTEVLTGINGALDVYDVRDGQRVARHSGPHDTSATDIAVDTAGRFIATSSQDKMITVWDASTIEPLRSLKGHAGSVHGVAFTPDGTRLVSGSSDETARVWNTENGECVATLLGHTGAVRSVAVAPDGNWLASGADDRTIRLWDLRRPDLGQAAKVIAGPGGAVYDVAFDPSNQRAALVTFGGWLRLWDVSSDETIRESKEAGKLFLTTFSPNGRLLACAGAGVLLGDAESGEQVWLGRVRGGAKSLLFSPDGSRVIATGRGTQRLDAPAESHLVVWDIASQKELVNRDMQGLVLAAGAPGGVRLAAFASDGASMRDLDSDAELFRFAGHDDAVKRVRFSPDGAKFLTACHDGTVGVWDAADGHELAVLRGHTEKVYDAVFSPDGLRIASCSNDNTMCLWDGETYEELLVLRGHERFIHAVAFSPDGSKLLSGSGDSTVRIWDTISRHRGLPKPSP